MFKRRVLEVAVQEVNKKTDMGVAYEIMKSGRHILAIRFKMKRKKKALAENKFLMERLKVFGIQEKQITAIFQKHDEAYILGNIEAVQKKLDEGGEIKNVAAYLMSAFEKDYRIQETEHSKAQKEKEALAVEQAEQEQQVKEDLAQLEQQYKQEKTAAFDKILA